MNVGVDHQKGELTRSVRVANATNTKNNISTDITMVLNRPICVRYETS